jgi:ABC-2 type transport system permease protein
MKIEIPLAAIAQASVSGNLLSVSSVPLSTAEREGNWNAILFFEMRNESYSIIFQRKAKVKQYHLTSERLYSHFVGKISLIIKREYLSRVRKKSFIVMTLLVPLLFAGLIIGVITLMLHGQDKHSVLVIDESEVFAGKLKSSNDIQFFYTDAGIDEAKKKFYSLPQDIILYVPYIKDDFDVFNKHKAQIFFKKQPGILLSESIKKQMENIMYDELLEQDSIDEKKVDEARKSAYIKLFMANLDEKGNEKESKTDVMYFFGFGSGLLIYIFILLYGIQVMRGVIEEKSNRIIEVIISSVKPFQLMMGKIIGVAMVGLTQFLMWVILSGVFFSIGQATFLKKYSDELIPVMQKKIPEYKGAGKAANYQDKDEKEVNEDIAMVISALTDTGFMIKLIGCFLFYFLCGYLLYSAMFAAFGAAVDNETETQQFMMPVTLPLVLAYIISVFIMQNPQSPVAFWFSMIPLTSPVVMMARLPFGVPSWELFVSMALLVATFIFMTWLAGKIYRTGILMYGKKVTYKELWKWLRYSG